MRRFAWSIVPVLIVGIFGFSGCKAEEGSPSDELPPPGGGMGGAVGGAGGMVTGGAGGMVAGGAGGMTAGAGGMAAGAGGGMVVGGAGGTTAGAGGMMAGSGGMAAGSGGSEAGSGGSTEAGSGGSAGTPAMDDVAKCISDAMAMGRSGPCAECGCNKCLAELKNCEDDACNGVVKCGQMAGCKGRACYCGATVNATDCALYGAMGPCMEEIATAAGVCMAGMLNMCAVDLAGITGTSSDTYDPMNPVSRANAVSVCTRGQVAEEATLLTPAVEAKMGKCETECM